MLKSTIATLLLTVCALFVAFQPSVVDAQEGSTIAPFKPLPLSTHSSASYNSTAQAWAIIHQRARIEADGRLLRTEFNKSIGYSPARPSMNASYMSNSSPLYYIPGREQFVNAGLSRSWYW